MWWRVHATLDIEDGPHDWNELNIGLGGFADHHSRWFDRDGEPIPMMVAEDLLADPDYHVLAKDVIIYNDGPLEVSTVWLGLDHNWMPEGRPKIFETMIFAAGTPWDLNQWRYSTEAEAQEGHAEVLAMVKAEAQERRRET